MTQKSNMKSDWVRTTILPARWSLKTRKVQLARISCCILLLATC